MKRKVLTRLLACVLTVCLIGPAGAMELGVLREAAPATDSASTIAPRAEETTWYYREYNGKTQRRLWSITEGKWLTDWIDVSV